MKAPRALVVTLSLASCAPLTDEVFTPLSLTSTLPFEVDEGAGVVEVPVRLTQSREQNFSLAYRLVGLDAQDGCQNPDFGAADGRVEWPAGALEASVPIWIADDDVAERDEHFELLLDATDATGIAPLGRIEVVILDNDRSELLDAQAFGVVPGAASDQSGSLQTVLDHAAELGRAVVVMAPGDYEMTSVKVSPGTTLSAHGVRWHRPPLSAQDVVSLRIEHTGDEASLATLVEGLSIDGRREEQGPYRDYEAQDAHLLALRGDNGSGGDLRAQLEGLALSSGTGSGLLVGPDSDVTVCDLRASELWRDALTLEGGGTQLKLRDFDATKTQGTGLWLGSREPGFGDSHRIEVQAEDLRFGAGDVEIEVSDQSTVTLQRLTMTAPPFRLDAPGGRVRIEDSVLMLGSSPREQWGGAHDVEISGTTLIASETTDSTADEPPPSSAIVLDAFSFIPGKASAGASRLAFTDCRFELARKAADNQPFYALANASTERSVSVSTSTLGAGFSNWFAPDCAGCSLIP